MPTISTRYHDLFVKRTIAHLATTSPDGTPHVTPVLVTYYPSVDRLAVVSESDSQKVANAEKNPAVSISMVDPDNPYRYLTVRGEITSVKTDYADRVLQDLVNRYFDEDQTDMPVKNDPVILLINPREVVGSESPSDEETETQNETMKAGLLDRKVYPQA